MLHSLASFKKREGKKPFDDSKLKLTKDVLPSPAYHESLLTDVMLSFQEQVIYKLTNLKKCANQCFKCKR